MTREINAGERKGARQEWRTGRELAHRIASKWCIDLDAMAEPSNTIVERFIAPPKPGFEAGSYWWRKAPPPERVAGLASSLAAVDAMRSAPSRFRYGGPIGTCVAVDAFSCNWSLYGSRIFCNPEFARIGRAVERAVYAYQTGALVVMLAPDNGDTRWYATLVDHGAAVLRFRGRVNFEPATAAIEESGAGFPSALYVLDGLAGVRMRRRKGDPIPTFACDPKTLELL